MCQILILREFAVFSNRKFVKLRIWFRNETSTLRELTDLVWVERVIKMRIIRVWDPLTFIFDHIIFLKKRSKFSLYYKSSSYTFLRFIKISHHFFYTILYWSYNHFNHPRKLISTICKNVTKQSFSLSTG